MWLFGTLGHPPEVGLAVGFAVRLRELVWLLPGILYLMVRGLGAWREGSGVAVPCRGASGRARSISR
jgi:hypothetical protein